MNALLRTGLAPGAQRADRRAGYRLGDEPLGDPAAIRREGAELAEAGLARARQPGAPRGAASRGQGPEPPAAALRHRRHREHLRGREAGAAAAQQGADVIAVIRTTAQSLLDYVPYGATTEGFGGTYATQENFRIMRAALDEVGERERRYIWLTNYCSGLCMPEIAAMGALERLDMMLNDSMYGILFRDINMYRTFVDQMFSRMINAYAGIIINTGEDNYLTTSRRLREGLHRPGQPVPERALRPRGRPAGPAHRARARHGDGPGDRERLPAASSPRRRWPGRSSPSTR